MLTLPNTIDLSLTIRSTELVPYSRKALLFSIQKTVIAEYDNVLVSGSNNLFAICTR